MKCQMVIVKLLTGLRGGVACLTLVDWLRTENWIVYGYIQQQLGDGARLGRPSAVASCRRSVDMIVPEGRNCKTTNPAVRVCVGSTDPPVWARVYPCTNEYSASV